MPGIEELPPEVVADAVAKAVVDAVSQGGDTETIVARALARAKADLTLSTGDSNGAHGEAAGPSLRGPVPTQPPLREAPPPTASHGPQAPSANGHHAPAPMGSGKAAAGVNGTGRPLLTEGDVLAAMQGGQTELRLAPGTIVTALARDAARDCGLRLVEG
ncbi:MAG: hypothetical protein HYU54_03830 [Actinobacteria bacterium]|nr:hypothetical protein [Actinomycetota bacterium]